MGWTSIYQLFWGSLGTRVLTHSRINLQLLPFCTVCTLSLPYQITWVLKHRLHPGFGYVAPAWGVAGHSDRTAFMTFMIHIYIYSYDQIGIYDSFIYDNYDKIPTWNVPGMSSAVRFARIAAWSQWIILTRPLCSNDGNQVLVARNCDWWLRRALRSIGWKCGKCSCLAPILSCERLLMVKAKHVSW